LVNINLTVIFKQNPLLYEENITPHIFSFAFSIFHLILNKFETLGIENFKSITHGHEGCFGHNGLGFGFTFPKNLTG